MFLESSEKLWKAVKTWHFSCVDPREVQWRALIKSLNLTMDMIMSPSRMMMMEMLKWSGDEVTMTRDSDTDSDKSLLSWWSDMCGTLGKECSSGKYDQRSDLLTEHSFISLSLRPGDINISLNIKCYQISSKPRINTSVSTLLTSLYCQEFHHTSDPELSWYFDLIIVIGYWK